MPFNQIFLGNRAGNGVVIRGGSIIGGNVVGDSVTISGNGSIVSGGDVWINGQRVGDSPTVEGDGILKSEKRDVKDAFHGVEAAAITELNVTCGQCPEVTVGGDSNLLEHIETRVEDGILHVGFKDNTSVNTRNPITVTVNVGSIDSINLSASTRATVDGLKSDEFEADLSSGSQLTLKGTAREIEANLSSGAQLIGQGLLADEVRAHASSGARGEFSVGTRLKVNASSGAFVGYVGNPTVKQSVSSGANVVKLADSPA